MNSGFFIEFPQGSSLDIPCVRVFCLAAWENMSVEELGAVAGHPFDEEHLI